VDFFGHPASTMSALAVLAARTGAPVVPAAIWREPDGRHVLELGAPIPFEQTGKLRRDVVRMTERYTGFIEAQIRAHPEQWLWTHKRWKTAEEIRAADAPPDQYS
jgi:KDO2-lipid IV(A) lauroyltransferase